MTSAAVERSSVDAALPAEALVLGVEDDRVRVRLAAGERGERTARVALPGYAPAEGDRVLVQATADPGAFYIIGVVRASRPAVVTTPSGASATADGDLLALRDAGGRVIATLDGSTGELRLAAEGDLRLSAPSGRVLIDAASDVEIEAGGRLAQRAKSIAVAAERAAHAIGVFELRAERIIERTTDALRTAEGLLETRAKHARTIVARTFELASRRTTIASEEDTRVDGKRVLLG